MYYRRHRRSHKRHAKKHVFGKRATRAIKAISQRPVETKWFIHTEDMAPLLNISYGNSAVFAYNILDTIPRADSVGVPSRSEVLGQQFELRGFSVRWLLYYPADGSGGVGEVLKARISIVDFTDYVSVDTFTSIGPSSFPFEDEDGNTNATMQRFDKDRVNVLGCKKFSLSQGGQTGLLSEGKMWVPKRKHCVIQGAEGGVFLGTLSAN